MQIECENEEEAVRIIRFTEELKDSYRENALEKAMRMNQKKIMKWCMFGRVNRTQANKLAVINTAIMLKAKENLPL